MGRQGNPKLVSETLEKLEANASFILFILSKDSPNKLKVASHEYTPTTSLIAPLTSQKVDSSFKKMETIETMPEGFNRVQFQLKKSIKGENKTKNKITNYTTN